ncbi:MAG: tRNA 2-selenouridine(34) synthase MnmH [Bacteroidetes bacterium]|nr:tRNA 2-selenouridine(34) synthase MnmH [Bacteroidota bacterium]
MVTSLEIDEFLKQSAGHLMIDVRSEGEYEYGHIPQAVNMPLFNNEERKIVGTLYKQQGKEEAIIMGRQIAEKKIPGFLEFVVGHKKSERVFVHCWRGGMRSEGVAMLLHQHGYKVSVLKGGYKSYRHRVLNILAEPFRFIVLGGKTGSGKTDVLQQLKQRGAQMVDLEALAQHKGSAFGALGQAAQPSTEHFENLVAEEMKYFDRNKPVWVEDESRTIGRVFLDLNLWNHMRVSPLFVIELPEEIRLKKLIREYGSFSIEELKESITKIKKRLGNEQWKLAIDALASGDVPQAVQIALRYYDKAYEKGIALKDTKNIIHLLFEDGQPDSIANTLIEQAHKNYGN